MTKSRGLDATVPLRMYDAIHNAYKTGTTSYEHRVAVERILRKTVRRHTAADFEQTVFTALCSDQKEPQLSEARQALHRKRVRRVLDTMQSVLVLPHGALAAANSTQALTERLCTQHPTEQGLNMAVLHLTDFLQAQVYNMWTLQDVEPRARLLEVELPELTFRELVSWKNWLNPKTFSSAH